MPTALEQTKDLFINWCKEGDKEAKSVIVSDYKKHFYKEFEIEPIVGSKNLSPISIDSQFSSGVVDRTKVSVYAKENLYHATDGSLRASAGTKIEITSANIDSGKQFHIVLANSYQVTSKFIVHAILDTETQLPGKKSIVEYTDQFKVEYDGNKNIKWYEVNGESVLNSANQRYLGNNKFALEHADIYRVKDILVGIDKTKTEAADNSVLNNFKDYFDWHSGQKDTHYDHGTIQLSHI